MHGLPLLSTIAAAFAAAWVLGLVTQRIGLSPIVGYLLAGVAIGPYTPGFVGNVQVANQLAEIGIILLMFGVGIHFHVSDLLAVRRVAIPGAVTQSVVATAVTMFAFVAFGWPWSAGLVLGVAMAVASTVVLLRVLMDHDMVRTADGRLAVGWLIVEDIFTVIVLVLVPVFGATTGGASAGALQVAWALAKLVALVAVVFLVGARVMPWVLVRVARLRSRELFTLTVLVFSITMAVGSSMLFGVSVALGAFLAGMVVGQSSVGQQAATDALPMRDAFAVLFFVSVGMLLDPVFLMEHPLLVLVALGVVLVVKPLAAVFIVALLGGSARTALTVAIGLAQIGEFSFILSEVSRTSQLLPEAGHHLLVAAALISISLNPLLFRSVPRLESLLQRWPLAWKLLNGRAERRAAALNANTIKKRQANTKPLAVIVGYGPVGRLVDAVLRDTGLETVIVDTSIETVEGLTRSGRLAIFGDATRSNILEEAGAREATHLVVTLPHSSNRLLVAMAARELNSSAEIIMRARYLSEREALERAGVSAIVFEEGEAGVALARHVLQRRGADEATIRAMLKGVRTLWKMA